MKFVFCFFLLVTISYLKAARNLDSIRIYNKSIEAKSYVDKKQLNTNYCILVDMSIHSGKNRFILWDFKGDSVVWNSLVSHGCCASPWGKENTKGNPQFNNIPDSHCSSLGKFRIGNRGYSSWGIHINYKLHGLESTNNKAYERLIVLHSWDVVSAVEVFPRGTPEGWGCPALSNSTLKKLDPLLQNNPEMLLWIFD